MPSLRPRVSRGTQRRPQTRSPWSSPREGALEAALGLLSPPLTHPSHPFFPPVSSLFKISSPFLFSSHQECEKELEEVERELTERNRGTSPTRVAAATAAAAKPSALAAAKNTLSSAAASVVPAVVLEAFTLTFLAEWGDRSQVATIGLATTANVWGEDIGERERMGRKERF